jgi:hypothetical protein
MTEAAIGLDYGVIADARRHRRRRWRGFGGVGVVAAALVGVGVAGHAGGGSGEGGGGAPRAAVSPLSVLRASIAGRSRLGSAVGELRFAPSIPMPAHLRAELSSASIVTGRFAPEFARGHLLTQAGEALQIWLVPGRNSLCLYTIYSSDDAGSTCQFLPEVADGELRITRIGSDGASVIGISPEGDLVRGGAPDIPVSPHAGPGI